MLRQSKKTDKELMKWYLDLCGADPGSYNLHQTLYHINSLACYTIHKVGTKTEQIETIDGINSFDGIAYIHANFKGNERVEDSVFMNNLYIYWDSSKEAKRLRRIRKIQSLTVPSLYSPDLLKS